MKYVAGILVVCGVFGAVYIAGFRAGKNSVETRVVAEANTQNVLVEKTVEKNRVQSVVAPVDSVRGWLHENRTRAD